MPWSLSRGALFFATLCGALATPTQALAGKAKKGAPEAVEVAPAEKPSKGKKGPPEPPRGPPPPLPPIQGPGPRSVDFGAPPLAAEATSVDLRKYVQERQRFTLEVDPSGVAALDEAHAAAVMDMLAADPRWRVTRWEGGEMALARAQGEDEAWTVPVSGYLGDGSARLWRTAVRFGPRGPEDPWASSSLVARAPPHGPTVAGLGWRMGEGAWKGWWVSALVVQGPLGALEIHELSPELDLDQTATAIQRVPPYLEALAAVSNSGVRVVTTLLSSREPAKVPAALTFQPMGEGEWELRGRLNAGQRGWTWVRVMDPAGLPWHEEILGPASLERLGWGEDPAGMFYLQSRLRLPEPPPPGGLAEAWFVGDDGGPPRLLGAFPIP